jgi:hypothetical protein
MSAPHTAGDGLSAGSMYHRVAAGQPRRRRTFVERLRLAARDHLGTAAFMVMLIASAMLVFFSR